MEIRYFQEFYCVQPTIEGYQDEGNKTIEAYYSLNRWECVLMCRDYHKNNIPVIFKKVYAEIDIDGAIIEVLHTIEEIDINY